MPKVYGRNLKLLPKGDFISAADIDGIKYKLSPPRFLLAYARRNRGEFDTYGTRRASMKFDTYGINEIDTYGV
ncbi:MAG TPA: hypothetical protein PLI57_11660 [Spirochaetota bacterium]|nr:hypothetical protein [Spirochaetota bacterium]